MRNGFQTGLGCFALLTALPSSAFATTCLDDAATFAERICGELSNRGSSQLITGTGELSAEAKGIIAKMFGSAQGAANVSEAVSSYENVAHEELAKDHANIRDCKARMVDVAVKQVCKQAAQNPPLFIVGGSVGHVQTDANHICGTPNPLLETPGAVGSIEANGNYIYGADCNTGAKSNGP
jgi:hypothetical protein